MKKTILLSLMLGVLPWIAMAQEPGDDIYFVPKKQKKIEKVDSIAKRTTDSKLSSTDNKGVSTVIVRDYTGHVRDIDEYNRREFSAEKNDFSVENDTLYIDERADSDLPGHWVNEFNGSQEDYEYAMRIVRFRNPRYAIPVSSPLYWDVVYGALPSWGWNVYDDGLYAYVFPTYTNRLWWDWRWSAGFYGPGWGFSWGWSSPWYYSGWYSWYHPWAGPYWAGYWGGYWGPGWHHPYYAPYYGGWGGHWAGPHYSYNNRRGEIGAPHPNRGTSVRPTGNRGSSYRTVTSAYDRNGRTGGRVVTGSRNTGSSVRSSAVRVGERTSTGYTRSSQLRSGESTYTRPSSTRVNSYRNSNAFDRLNNNSSRQYNVNRETNTNRTRSTYSTGTSTRSNFGGSSFRSTSGGGSSTRSVGTGGGGARRR